MTQKYRAVTHKDGKLAYVAVNEDYFNSLDDKRKTTFLTQIQAELAEMGHVYDPKKDIIKIVSNFDELDPKQKAPTGKLKFSS